MHTCHNPYENRANKKSIWNAVIEGPPARPLKAEKECAKLIPDAIWQLLLDCWNSNPDERPSVNKIIRRIESGNLSKS